MLVGKKGQFTGKGAKSIKLKSAVFNPATDTVTLSLRKRLVLTKKAQLTIDGLGGSYGLERLALHRMLPQMGPPETTIWEFPFPDRSFAAELDNFAAAIAGQEPLLGDIHDAVANLKIVEKAYQQSS